jgi:hypothetical protein
MLSQYAFDARLRRLGCLFFSPLLIVIIAIAVVIQLSQVQHEAANGLPLPEFPKKRPITKATDDAADYPRSPSINLRSG